MPEFITQSITLFDLEVIDDFRMGKEADFLVHIGPDLVPPYKDGDLLMIQKQPDVFEGEIGLFLIDGKPHVKKRGKGCLISLNPSIEPVPMSDNVQGLGKVLGVVDPEWIGKEVHSNKTTE